MARRYFPRLSAYAALLLLALGLVQLLGSLAFYQLIDRQTLREDHARRVAELLVVSDRVHALGARPTDAMMTTRHLAVTVSPVPLVARPQHSDALDEIAGKIGRWEPGLARRTLHLATEPHKGDGQSDLIGSMRLADGNWLNFRSRDISSMWPVALRATLLTVGSSLACLGVGLIVLRRLTAPLRRLSEAAVAIGEGQAAVQIRETGPADLRNLARSMNEMQGRIAALLRDQAKSFEAISHDLRTPLARQQLAADLIADPEIAGLVRGSAQEMEAMLQSLQHYLRAQHLAADPAVIDLDGAVRGLLADHEGRSQFESEGAGAVDSYAEPLMLALQALIENAARFGEQIDVTIRQEGGRQGRTVWLIEIHDNGPGVPATHFDDLLTPFFRLDEARARDTKGFGLGIPTAFTLLRRFGGDLSFRNAPQGGLIAQVEVPQPLMV